MVTFTFSKSSMKNKALIEYSIGWCEQVGRFLEEPDKYSVLVFDNRGVGRSTITSFPPYGTSTIAQDVLCLLDCIGWDHFHLVGISMGGMVSLEIASKAPQRLLSLMLINTHAGGLGAFPPIQGLLTVFWGMLNNDMAAGDRTKFGDPVYADEKLRKRLNERLINSWLNMRKLPTNDSVGASLPTPPTPTTRPPAVPISTFFYQGLGTFLHHLSHEQLKEISNHNIPTTIVVSTDDYLVRPSNGLGIYESMKGPHVRLHLFKNGGHAIIAEAIEQFNNLLFHHLDTVIQIQNQNQKFKWTHNEETSMVIPSNL